MPIPKIEVRTEVNIFSPFTGQIVSDVESMEMNDSDPSFMFFYAEEWGHCHAGILEQLGVESMYELSPDEVLEKLNIPGAFALATIAPGSGDYAIFGFAPAEELEKLEPAKPLSEQPSLYSVT